MVQLFKLLLKHLDMYPSLVQPGATLTFTWNPLKATNYCLHKNHNAGRSWVLKMEFLLSRNNTKGKNFVDSQCSYPRMFVSPGTNPLPKLSFPSPGPVATSFTHPWPFGLPLRALWLWPCMRLLSIASWLRAIRGHFLNYGNIDGTFCHGPCQSVKHLHMPGVFDSSSKEHAI